MHRALLAIAFAVALVVAPVARHARADVRPTVAWVGDSTMNGERPWLPASDEVLAQGGIDQQFAIDNWGPVLRADPPAVVVFSIGLNDADTGLGFVFRMQVLIDQLPTTTRVVWLKPVVSPTCRVPGYWPSVVNLKSGLTDAVAVANPNVTVLDWSPAWDLFSPEGIHYTTAGWQQRAAYMVAEVNKLTGT